MKQLPLLSLVLLFFIFACEPDVIDTDKLTIDTSPIFRYNTQQQFPLIQTAIIDFEKFTSGDIVSEVRLNTPFQNVQVLGTNPDLPNSNVAMIFDSSNPTGNDFDIATPNETFGGPGKGNGGMSNDISLGNVLILSEDLDSSDPDDAFVIGANYFFDFSANELLTLKSFDILDIEEFSEATVVRLYDISGTMLLTKEIAPGGNNSKVTVDLENTTNVAFMEILMNNSGAIDNIAMEIETMEDCVECDSSITSIVFRYIGESPEAMIRIVQENDEVIFEDSIPQGGEFEINGALADETFGGDITLFLNDQRVGTLATDCSEVIGPGFFIEGLEIISGRTLNGGQLCPIEIF